MCFIKFRIADYLFTTKIGILIFFLSLNMSTLAQPSSKLVYLENGTLSYSLFAVTGQSDSIHIIPDFSHAGYMGGGVKIPEDLPVKATVVPEAGDDTRRIQEAIDNVSVIPPDENGFRGAVLIKKGYYSLNKPLLINTSGIVLRGEGQGKSGSVLHSNQRIQHTVIQITGSGSLLLNSSTTQKITSAYVPIGSKSFVVASTAGYAVGDTIAVTRTPNQDWILALGVDDTMCAGDADCDGWTPESYTINHERVITQISGDTIVINIPVVDPMETQYGGGEISKASSSNRVRQIGIEDIRLESLYTSSTDEDHGWTAVGINNAENCWVRGITAVYFGFSAVSVSNANFNTIQDCAFIKPVSKLSGGRRYSFVVQGGLGNLFQRNYADNGRHDFATGSRVAGPNVFLDGLGESGNNDIGPHHRWATGLLFDNIEGNQIRVRNRGSSGSGHGWAGAQTLFWNLTCTEKDITVESPVGGINWGIGCKGPSQLGEGYWESWGTHVLPRSLYLQQLKDRLGEEAVNNITCPEQLTGEIAAALKSWQGIGSLGDGGDIGQMPEIAFVNPGVDAINVAYWEGTDIEITATDNDGTISNVTLLINGEPIATLSQSPYLFENVKPVFENLPEGGNNCYAIAIDNDGNTQIARLIVYGKKKEKIDLSTYEGIALCQAYAANYQEGRDAYFAIDKVENNESRWSSEEYGTVLVVKACDARHIDAIGIRWYEGGERQAIFDLEVSLDSINWNPVYSGNSSGTIASQEPYAVNDSIKYMRYTGYGNTSNRWSSIIEVGFYKALKDTSSKVLHAEEMSKKLLIYPNPSKGEVSILNPFEGNTNVKVSDLSGKTHLQFSSTSKEFILESAELAPGIYLIQVHSNHKVANGMLVISK